MGVDSVLVTRGGLVNEVAPLPVGHSAADAGALRDGLATDVGTLVVRTRGFSGDVDPRLQVIKEKSWLRLRVSTFRPGDRLCDGTGFATCSGLKESRSILANGFEPDWLSMAPSIWSR